MFLFVVTLILILVGTLAFLMYKLYTGKEEDNKKFAVYVFEGLASVTGKIGGFFSKIGSLFKTLWKYKIRVIGVILLIWGFFYIKGLLTSDKIWANVPPGHKGVIFNRFGGGMKDSLLGEGSSFYMPFLQSVYIADLTRQSARIKKITADSKEFQDVVLDVNVEFSLQPENLLVMYRKYGMKSIKELSVEVIEPNVNEAVKNIVIEYPIFEVLLAQSEIKKALKLSITTILEEYYITVYDVDIENILISSRFRNTVADTELARARKEGEEILLEQTRIQSERKLLEAQNRKQLKILEAEGIAEYNKLVSSQGVNQTILELKRLENKAKAIEKWDGVLPGQTGELQSWPFD